MMGLHRLDHLAVNTILLKQLPSDFNMCPLHIVINGFPNVV